MNRYAPILAAALACIAGCDVLNLPCSFFFGACPTETGSAKLIPFESEQDLIDYFREQMTADNDGFLRGGFGGLDMLSVDFGTGAPDLSPTPVSNEAGFAADDAAAPQDGSFSQTTLQEIGVDEADVIKSDGEFLYIVSGSLLRTVRIDPVTNMALLAEVTLDGFGREMYLYNNRIIVLSEQFGGSVFVGGAPVILEARDEEGREDGEGAAVADDMLILPAPSRPQTVVTIYDTTDPANPVMTSKTSFDGTTASSRMIGGMLYLVVANYEYYYHEYDPSFAEQFTDSAGPDVRRLLPRFTRVDADGSSADGNVLTWEELQRPTDPDGYGVIAVVSMDVDAGGTFQANGIIAEPGNIYSSTGALYLTDSEVDFFGGSRQSADIYKFAYQDGLAVPVATGSVPGRILNQYSMGEHNGYLRVATTVSDAGFLSEPHNDVYVLGQQADELVVVGSVQGIAPRETIQSARFVGDRGFVVTFERVDPLFTLDLSDPRNPRVIGELKVPGFSTYIVPMDEDHLLTVGQYIPDGDQFFGPWGVQLSIFDISDFANPVLKHNVVLGDQTGAYSEALYNPKAFTYLADDGLIGLPVSIYEESPFFFDDVIGDGPSDTVFIDAAAPTDVDGTEPMIVEDGADVEEPIVIVDPPPGDIIDVAGPIERGGFDGIVVYQVSSESGFSEMNRISTRFDQAGYFAGSFTRARFFDGNALAISDIGIRAATVGAQESASAELFLGSPFEGDLIEPVFAETEVLERD